MSWLITYQDYDYSEPMGIPRTVITETNPVKFRDRHTHDGNRTCVILFAMEVS